jgi:prephenate dehydrogenase (NADP+)
LLTLASQDGYREKFEKIQKYFEPRFPEATKVGNEMIRTIEENLNSRKKAEAEAEKEM